MFATVDKNSNNRVHLMSQSLSFLRATLMLVLFGAYEFIFVHKFFIHTFFRSSISDVPPPIDLKISYWDKLQFKTILLVRYLLKDQFWGQQWFKSVHCRILEHLEHQNFDLSNFSESIPIVEMGEISAKDYWKTFVRKNTPVIIRGGAKHTFAYKNWTVESFRERFGDFGTEIVSQGINDQNDSTFKPVYSKLKDVIDSANSNEKLYIAFCADIFSAYPELLDELSCLDFQEYMGGASARFVGAQLFLGADSSTGSDVHCANGNNLFFQIQGRKKWTFIHPDYLWLMYPMLDRFFLYCASFVKRDYDEAYLDQYAPLQKYVPTYEAVLEPGDILLNPPWQWHAIDNLTGGNIAVATRWSPAIGHKSSNTFFDAMQFISPYMWRIKLDLLVKNSEDLGLLDERTDNLVQTQDSFVGLGKESETPIWEFDKWPKECQF